MSFVVVHLIDDVRGLLGPKVRLVVLPVHVALVCAVCSSLSHLFHDEVLVGFHVIFVVICGLHHQAALLANAMIEGGLFGLTLLLQRF